MEIDFYTQTNAFLYSFLLGVGLGAIYGLFKVVRVTFLSGKISVIICDVIYMLIVCLSLFFYSLAMLYGFIRFYVIAGVLVGFILYRMTIGRLLFRVYEPFVAFAKKILRKITTKFKIYSKKLLKILYKILYNSNIKISTFRNKRLRDVGIDKKEKANNEKRKHKEKRKHIA